MAWIKTISYEESKGKLRSLYDRIKGPGGHLDAIMKVHSLRPHTLEGHMALYKSVLHHAGNRLPRWLLEAVGLYVSLLNECAYCVAHHFEGMKKALPDEARADALREALEREAPEDAFDERGVAVLRYAEHLTGNPAGVSEAQVEAMKRAELDEGEILEVNQVVSYFAYANRVVLGLGVRADEDLLGLSPSDADDPANWHHR